MTQTVSSEFESLKGKLDEAVGAPDVTTIAHQIKAALQDVLRRQDLSLPERFHTSLPDTYARRLLHRDPDGRYTVVVMTWGPGQKTALHDHAGIWCVECVVDGRDGDHAVRPASPTMAGITGSPGRIASRRVAAPRAA